MAVSNQELIDFIKPIYRSVIYGKPDVLPIQGLKSKLCSLDMDPMSMVTYKVMQDSKIYDVIMPRSKTFDLYLEFPGSDDIIYGLSPVEELLDTICAIQSNNPDPDLSDKQRYILGFLDLAHTSYQTQPLHQYNDLSMITDVSYNLIEITLSATGKILHGVTTITYTRIDWYSSKEFVQLNFNYGRVVEFKDHLYTITGHKYTTCIKYRNGLPLNLPVKTWNEIFDMFYGWPNYGYNYRYAYMIVYQRLTEDGVIDGLTGKLLELKGEHPARALTLTTDGSLVIQSKGRDVEVDLIINTVKQTIGQSEPAITDICSIPDIIHFYPSRISAEMWRTKINRNYDVLHYTWP